MATRKWIFGVSLLLTGMVLLSACSGGSKAGTTPADGGGSKAAGESKQGGTINYGLSDEPDTLDVQKSGMAVVNSVGWWIGGSMLAQDPESKKYVCYLCDSYEVSADGLTWSFKLKENAKFHDGNPLKAVDWKWTFERAQNPDTKAKNAGALVKEVKSVEAVSDYELKITLNNPFAPFADALSTGFLAPLSKAAAEKEDYGRNPVGAGPYAIAEWRSGERIALKRNPDFNWAPAFYQSKGPVMPDELVFQIIPEEATRIAALESGDVDITNVNYQNVDRFKSDGTFEVLSIKRQGLGLFVIFNLERPELQDPKVRQAINSGINRDAIIKSVLRGFGKPAYGPLPEVYFGYDPGVEQTGYRFDPEKAKKLLEDAGYKKGAEYYERDGKVLTLNLFTQTSGTWKAASELIQADLKEVGIKVDVQPYEWATLTAGLTNGKHDMSLMGYTYADPDVVYLFLHSSQIGQGINWSKVNDPALDRLIELGRASVDPAKRADAYKQLQALMIEKAYWAPVYNEEQFFAINKRVQGVWMHPTKGLQYMDASVQAK